MTTNSKNKISVIDIGSNSLRQMTAGRTGGEFLFSAKTVRTTRLAEDFLPDRTLKAPSIGRSMDVLRAFKRMADEEGLPSFAYATSAVRDAANREAFVGRIETELGIPVDVLSGEEEAFLARLGAGIKEDEGMIDIGGGSFQISAGDFRQSFPLGCVKIKTLCGNEEETLPLLSDILPGMVASLIGDTALPRASRWTAVGGTATKIACLVTDPNAESYSPEAVKSATCTPERLDALLEELGAIPLAERWNIPLLQRRADVILGGGALLRILMDKLGIASLRFSDADGLEGFAMKKLSEQAD